VNEYGYRLKTKGMNDEDYRNNPQVLYLHFRGDNFFLPPSRPSETIIGSNQSFTKHKDGFLSAITKFAETDLGEEIMQFNKAGLLNAWSVSWGWMEPDDWEKDYSELDGVPTVGKWRLKEYSSCPLPANPDATNRLNLETMLSQSRVPYFQQSLSSAIVTYDLKAEIKILTDKYNELKSMLESSGTVTQKDLTELKTAFQSQLGDLKKYVKEILFEITSNNLSFKTNLDKETLIKMEKVANDCILRYAGKIQN
jgi:hypothetical protein